MNGEVECFSGSHLYLGVAAGIILLLAFLLTVTTTVLPLTQARHKVRYTDTNQNQLPLSSLLSSFCQCSANVMLYRSIYVKPPPHAFLFLHRLFPIFI